MRIDREKLLMQLESVEFGISKREIIEQSSCFVFKDKTVMTFNDEIACTQDSCLSINGAVQAMPLISILRKLTEERLEITVNQEELLIRGNRKKIGIRMEAEISLPIESVERPGEWTDLPDDFSNAISMVQNCVGKDESKFSLTCIHLHPKWVEACDGFEAARYRVKLGIEKPILVRRDSIKCIIDLDMIKLSVTNDWIHFKNSSGLVLSCRRWIEDYPKLSGLLKEEGVPTKFPKGLIEAIEKAAVFSMEDAEDNQVTIELRPNKLRITGKGASGYYQEIKNIKYDGKVMSFKLHTQLFLDLIRHHHTCEITPNKLKIADGKYTYITVLQIPLEEKKKGNKKKTKKETNSKQPKYENDDIPF